MANFLEKILGDPNKKALKALQPLVDRVNALEDSVVGLSDEQLKAKTTEFKERLEKGETLDQLMPEAFAVVREAAKRTIGERHYNVQLMGGIVLHKGKISEMKTGEGKTLVSTLPGYLNALTGKGVHVVTVNDYLAKRDAENMGKIYEFLGLTVGVVTPATPQHERQAAYAADITYATNNELGFDYLRDNMASNKESQVQRKLNFAIVDEVDSILVDEARTPLIISAADEQSTDLYRQFAQVANQLVPETDYSRDEKMRSALLLESGIDKLQKILGIKDVYESGNIVLAHHIEQALRAKEFYKVDKDYVIKDGEIIIVDEFTGRLMVGRRYSEGLHQAIEAKEGVEIKRESKTLATITFQNFFRLYEKLSGMTGTAKTEEEEFWKIYGLEVVVIPTNQPMIRDDRNDLIYINENAKFKAVVEEIKSKNEKGQPVLVGTIAIEKSEALSNLLKLEGVKHEVLNAKQHEREAQIIKDAGQKGAVTIATNMAGRGTDIKLGEGVTEVGGLHILGTERHESRRIDNQLRGRAGRQGDPGSSQFFVSMEDDLMRLFGAERMKNMMQGLKIPENEPLEHKWISASLESAQKRVEGHNFDIRKRVVEYDDVMNRHRAHIYSQRQTLLEKGEVKDEVVQYVETELQGIISTYAGQERAAWDLNQLIENINVIFVLSNEIKEKILSANSSEQIQQIVLEESRRLYEHKENEVNPEAFRQAERAVMLRVIDMLWIEHLDAMMKLREAIGLHGYGQRDPLVEYKQEGYMMFQRLQAAIASDVARLIYKVQIVNTLPEEEKPEKIELHAGDEPVGSFEEEKEDLIELQEIEEIVEATEKDFGIHNDEDKVGRNDPCPCGSGKKFKKCGMINTPEHQRLIGGK